MPTVAPFYKSTDGTIEIYCGNCLDTMPTLEAASVDAIVCDPPYGFSFMGRAWDHGVPGVAFWREALRVAKPGAHLLAFGGTRTHHRLMVAIEDAGWEIRDCLNWLYGQGFPKSLDVSKAIDKAAGAEREPIDGPVVYGDGHIQQNRSRRNHSGRLNLSMRDGVDPDPVATKPATDAARKWSGWGTALKPAWEPIILARKPLDGTVAANVQRHGTGAINVDACRVPLGPEPNRDKTLTTKRSGRSTVTLPAHSQPFYNKRGRWPANVLHDGSDEVLSSFPETTSVGHTPKSRGTGGLSTNGHSGQSDLEEKYFNSGSAARFFYCAKASAADRGDGNKHETVKPTELMRYLCRLITPIDGTILDPFMGSGSTGKAAALEGFRFIGIDLDESHCETAAMRKREVLESQALFRSNCETDPNVPS